MFLLAVISGFLLALIAPWVNRAAGKSAGALLATLPAILFVFFLSLVEGVVAGSPVVEVTPWIPSLGVDLSFRADGLGLLFCLLITGVGTAVIAYTGTYLAEHVLLGRLQAFLLAFMASMLGLVLSDNLLVLFLFWELTAVTSYLLIGFDHEVPKARAAALQALLVNGMGGLCMLAGVILLANIGGTLSITELLPQADVIRSHPHYLAVLVLLLMGAFTKSAQFPFQFWLPGAMAAPSPVSAYLHSATMVKAGVYLLMRMTPVMGGTEEWFWTIAPIGALTMLIGAVMAFFKTDLKQLLAHTTVSMLGALTMLVGFGTETAMSAAIILLVVHSLYKGTLFLVTGTVDHKAGTREIGQLGGLRHKMPVTAVVATLAGLAMAGLPPMLGFIAKELWYESALHVAIAAPAFIAASIVANALNFALAGVAVYGVFYGRPAHPKEKPYDPAWQMAMGPAAMAVMGLAAGVVPALIADPLAASSMTATGYTTNNFHLALFHGINLPLMLSLVTFALGIAFYVGRVGIRQAGERYSFVSAWGPEGWYDQTLATSLAFAHRQTKLLQSGYLRSYVMVVVLSTIVIVGVSVTWGKVQSIVIPALDVRIHEALLAIVILSGAWLMIKVRSILAAVAALGVVGYGVALMFYLFSAPDLAMTQLSIETLSVILFVLVLWGLPEAQRLSPTGVRRRDGAVALTAGGLMTLFLLVVLSDPFQSRLSQYFTDNSATEAYGRNVVNVILVDFRAFDTMGEITVLAVASIGVYALLKMRRPERDKK